MSADMLTRRAAVLSLGAGGLMLSGCDKLTANQSFAKLLQSAEQLSQHGQRLVLGSATPLAREYTKADISRVFKANGSVRPETPIYRQLVSNGFMDWRLKIEGLVDNPMEWSLDQLKAMPARTQITRHDCVEGWSAIGEWTGVPLATLLKPVGLKPNARYLVFHCADNLDNSPDASGIYYESIDLIDAFHPQTIMAYAMNGETLPIRHGAPIRLRVERQLGYKMAKYVLRIEAVENFSKIGFGKGGYWEDRGYEWYAGI